MRAQIVAVLLVASCGSSTPVVADMAGGDSAISSIDMAIKVDAPLGCPATVPEDGVSCGEENLDCLYMNCGDFGIATVVCVGGAWQRNDGACDVTACGNPTVDCDPAQLCVSYLGDASLTQCAANTCGTGPLTCDCVCSPGEPCTKNGTRWSCLAH